MYGLAQFLRAARRNRLLYNFLRLAHLAIGTSACTSLVCRPRFHSWAWASMMPTDAMRLACRCRLLCCILLLRFCIYICAVCAFIAANIRASTDVLRPHVHPQRAKLCNYNTLSDRVRTLALKALRANTHLCMWHVSLQYINIKSLWRPLAWCLLQTLNLFFCISRVPPAHNSSPVFGFYV